MAIGPPKDVFTHLAPSPPTIGPALDVFEEPTSTGGVGTVTSIDVDGGTTGLSTTGGPVTTAGTITIHLLNNVQLAGRNSTNSGDVGIVGVDTSNRITISSLGVLDPAAGVQSLKMTVTSGNADRGFVCYEPADGNAGGTFATMRSGGTATAPTIIPSGALPQAIGNFSGIGYDGVVFRRTGIMQIQNYAAASAGHIPTQFGFYVSDGATDAINTAVKMTLNDQGQFAIAQGASSPTFSYSGFQFPDTDGTNGQFLKTDGSKALSFASVTSGASGNAVATLESTNSVTYTDLATPGPSVTVTTGTTALVLFSAVTQRSTATAGQTGFASFAISGATTLAANDDNSSQFTSPTGAFIASGSLSRAILITGLTAGSNTFTMKYRVDGATFNFFTRSIAVLP